METIAAKAVRYLVEGRVTVLEVRDGFVRASCRGSGAVYEASWQRGEGWLCSCPARTECSHLIALKTIVVIDGVTHA
jgi:uncharacterized Zn finger protein